MNVARSVRRRGALTLVILGGVLATAFATAAIGSTGASSAVPADPRVAVLQKQVRLLQAQVRALRTQNNEQWGEIGAGWASQNCLGAQVADLIQGTWGVIDQVGQAEATPTTYFGSQTQVPDYGACGQISKFADSPVPRGGIQVPPKVDSLLPLLKWIHG